MDRRILVRLHDYFSKIENPTGNEKSLLAELTTELSYFHIASVCRADLLNAGFDPTGLTDRDMEQLANRLYESYIEPKYAPVLEEVRNKFSAEIAEADANPDKWYEVFVADETGETHSEDSGNTFDEAVANFERIVDKWGLEKTSIDIWENRESPNNILQIK